MRAAHGQQATDAVTYTLHCIFCTVHPAHLVTRPTTHKRQRLLQIVCILFQSYAVKLKVSTSFKASSARRAMGNVPHNRLLAHLQCEQQSATEPATLVDCQHALRWTSVLSLNSGHAQGV